MTPEEKVAVFEFISLAETLKKKHTLEMCIKISNNVIENNYSKDELNEIWEHLNQIV